MENVGRTTKAIALTSVLALAGSVSGAWAQDSCRSITGHIDGQIIGPNGLCGGALTEVGTFTGEPGGTFVACVTDTRQRGDGAVVFDLVHTYTFSGGGTVTTTDRVVAGPIAPPLYRINNRASITGGTGRYQSAFGFIRDHGTVNLDTGVVSVDYRGRVCTP
jgi:hypothetical protein